MTRLYALLKKKKKVVTFEKKPRAKIYTARFFGRLYFVPKKENEWDFGQQNSLKAHNLPDRKIPDYYSMVEFMDSKRECYTSGNMKLYPGQKIWIVRIDNRNGRYSVDYDYVAEVFRFGHRRRGDLVDYWLQNYGFGHGPDYGSVFATKNEAIWAMNHCYLGSVRQW